MVLDLFAPVEVLRLNLALLEDRVEVSVLSEAKRFVGANFISVLVVSDEHTIDCEEPHV